MRSCKFDNIMTGRFQPIPGKPIFNELVKEGKIPPDYMPPSGLKLLLPFQKKLKEQIYTPFGSKHINLEGLIWRETIYLFIRNPST